MSDKSSVNEGIQGSVTADVLAIGRGARAAKTVTISKSDQAGLTEAMEELKRAILSLDIPPQARDHLTADMASLKTAIDQHESKPGAVTSIIEKMSEKLKLLSSVSENVAGVVGPLVKIAGIFHLSALTQGLLS